MSEIAAKLYVRICISVHGLSLVKACIHAGWVCPSSIYSMKYDI